jgi:hypothetical protein
MKDHCFRDSHMLRRASLILMMYHLSAEGVACRLDVQAIAVFLAGALLVFLSFSTWVCSLFLEGIDAWVSHGIAGVPALPRCHWRPHCAKYVFTSS